MRSQSKPPVDEKTTEEDSCGPHRSTPSSNRDNKGGPAPAEKSGRHPMPPSSLIMRRHEQQAATQVKKYETTGREDPPGDPMTSDPKESLMLRDIGNERQLKNSETCPDQLTPKLPITSNRNLSRKLKKPTEKLSQVATNTSVNQGKASANRRNLTLDRE